MTTIKEAIAQARKYNHGSRYHFDAMNFLFKAHRKALPGANPSLDELWSWIEGYLELEEASYGPTPLG